MFTFDKKTALAAEADTYTKIEESGSYKVTIKQAYVTKGQAPKQSEALTMEIVTDKGAEGRIFLWYQKADGTQNEYAVAAVNAVMGVLKMRELDKSKGLIDAYDYELKQPVKKEGEVFEALKGKQLQIALQAKWDEYNGKARAQLELRCPATVDGFTVSEVLDGSTKPAMYERALARLKPIGPKPDSSAPMDNYAPPIAAAAVMGTADDPFDSIPF